MGIPMDLDPGDRRRCCRLCSRQRTALTDLFFSKFRRGHPRKGGRGPESRKPKGRCDPREPHQPLLRTSLGSNTIPDFSNSASVRGGQRPRGGPQPRTPPHPAPASTWERGRAAAGAPSAGRASSAGTDQDHPAWGCVQSWTHRYWNPNIGDASRTGSIECSEMCDFQLCVSVRLGVYLERYVSSDAKTVRNRVDFGVFGRYKEEV
jgi:hypothetical protein